MATKEVDAVHAVINLPGFRHPSVVDRYYTDRYKTDCGKKKEEDLCILTHSNKISLICLAATHPVLSEKKEVVKVNFQVDSCTNRLDNKVTGKGKRGAQNVTPSAPLCQISCSDGANYIIPACIKGNLIEVNDNLLNEPHLLTTKPLSEGYIAIVFAKLKAFDSEMRNLKSRQQYEEVLAKRLCEKVP